jgi:Domain of unknown function (DUF4124)
MSGFHLGSAFAVVLSAAASGGAYRWVDAQGGVHYGDQPPGNAVAEPVQPPLPPGSGEEQKALQELSQQRSRQDAEEAKRRDELRQQKLRETNRKTDCTAAQTRRERLDRPRQLEMLPDGSARRLTEEERQARIRETESRITENCSDGH